ncbi:hypothetical protein Tco_1429072 [Tanacetum coccineum]
MTSPPWTFAAIQPPPSPPCKATTTLALSKNPPRYPFSKPDQGRSKKEELSKVEARNQEEEALEVIHPVKSKEEHEVHLKLVLESLRKEKLYAKFSKLGDALSRKERVKSRRVRGMILADQSEEFKQENILVEMLHDNSKEWNSGDDQLRLRWMIYLVVLADAAESVRDAIGFEYCLASSSGWTKSPVLWAEIGESSLTGLELVQETTDKVVLVKEKPKAARDRQKSYVDYRRKPLEFEVGDRVLLKVTPWKGVVRFRKKGKLAPRYVGPFEILERIGLVAYRLRLLEELNSVHDTFHVSNLKKLWIEKLKRRKIAPVKVGGNSKRGPEFTWEHEDQMRIKYPQLLVMPLDMAKSSFV